MRAVASLLLLGPLAGCVLLVPDFEPGAHCTFEGGESACAQCMRSSCQLEIDACCGSKDCREGPYSFSSGLGSTMAAVDTCGKGGSSSSCGSALESADETPAGEAVRACVVGSCRAECAPNAVAVKWSCDSPRTDTKACGRCIYSSCGARVEACCKSGSCAKAGFILPINGEISNCLSGETAACAYAMTRSDGDSGTDGALRACVAESCADPCFGDGTLHRSCGLTSGGKFCSCTVAETSRGECSPDNTDGGTCVETGDGGCICGHYACDSSLGARSCSCSFGNDAGATDTCNWEDLGVSEEFRTSKELCCLETSRFGVDCECKSVSSGRCERGASVPSCDQSAVFAALTRPRGGVCTQ